MFEEMADRPTPRIHKQDTNMRRARAWIEISHYTQIFGHSLVPDVCQAIYDDYHQELIKCLASQ